MKGLKKCVRNAISQNKNWRIELDKFLLHYRATEHTTTGQSPGNLMFGRPMKTKLPQLDTPVNDKKIRQRDRLQKQRMQFYANKRKAPEIKMFRRNTPCLIRTYDKTKKAQIWDSTIYKVVHQKGSSIKLMSDQGTVRYRNVCHVKQFYTDRSSKD